MKKVISILFILGVCLSLVTTVQADSSVPGGTFASSITIQNLGSGQATVSVKYVKTDGTEGATSTHTIPVGDVEFIYVPHNAGLIAGQYSVVISSDQPVAAVSNFADEDSGASYSGFQAGANSWYFPAAYDNYYTYYSEIIAQNVTASAQNVTLKVFAPGDSTAVYQSTKMVPAFASTSFSLVGLNELATNVVYSAELSAPDAIVGISNIWGSGATAPQLYSYNGFSTGAKVFYVPSAAKNYYGWNASVNIQNVSSLTANVTVTYSNGYSTNYTIPSKSGHAIFVPNEPLPDGLHSVKVESDQDVVVTLNQSNNFNRAATYNGASGGTTTVALPNVMRRYYKYSSSISCQNIGSAATTMTVNFANEPAATDTSPSIEPNASWLWYLPNMTNLPIGFNASAVVTSSGQPIICIANSNMEDAPESTQNRDELKIYNGVNR